MLTKTLSQLSRTYLDFGHTPEGEAANAEATRLARDSGFGQYLAGCLNASARILSQKAAVAGRQGRHSTQRELMDQAISLGEEAVDEARRIGTLKLLNITLFALGRNLRTRGRGDDRTRALACFEESLDLNRRIGNLRGQAGAYLDIGEARRMLNDSREAVKALRRSLRLQRQADNRLGEAESLEALIKVFLRNHPKRAAVFFRRCEAIYDLPEMARYKRQWNELQKWVKQRTDV